MRGDRPFTYMANAGAKQQGDEARAYAVIMSQLQDLDDRSAFDRDLAPMKEAVYATMRQMPTLEVERRMDLIHARARREHEARQKWGPRDERPGAA